MSYTDFGAPVLNGTSWGRMVALLRACLVSGYNKRTDVISITIKDANTIVVNFTTPHMYNAEQTIEINGTSIPDLTGEFVIRSVTSLSITCDLYRPTQLTGDILALSEVTTIASSLGMIEEFRENDKSVFRTNEPQKNCFLVIDDNVPSSPSLPYKSPLVYMTDNMPDINTDGKLIVPYDIANPTYHRNNSYGTSKNGIWSFPSYIGVLRSNLPPTPELEYTVPWYIIGNDKFFYFYAIYSNTGSAPVYRTHSFGRFKSFKENDNHNYMLIGSCTGNKGSGTTSVNTSTGFLSTTATTTASLVNHKNEIYQMSVGILGNYNGRSTCTCYFSPTASAFETSSNISGNGSSFPSFYSSKLLTSRVNIVEIPGNYNRGLMPGLLWLSHDIPYPNASITRHRYNNKITRLFHLIYPAGMNGYSTPFKYSISLNNTDWDL